MRLQDLIIAVKEQKLDKNQLEAYRDELVSLFGQMQIEIADLEKEEALFLNHESDDSEATRKRKWKATEKGQRLIVLKRYATATNKLLDSLKSRLYNFL